MPTSIPSPEVEAVFDQAQSPRTKRVRVGNETVDVADKGEANSAA